MTGWLPRRIEAGYNKVLGVFGCGQIRQIPVIGGDWRSEYPLDGTHINNDGVSCKHCVSFTLKVQSAILIPYTFLSNLANLSI